MSLDHNYHLIAFSDKGKALMTKLYYSKDLKLMLPDENPQFTCYDGEAIRTLGGIKAVCGKIFQANKTAPQTMVFICATGIAVRAISPYVGDKLTDPPVLVIDDYGRFVISLLSGHLGNANNLCRLFSNALMKLDYEGIPVITTATDVRGVAGIEPLLQHYQVDIESMRKDIKIHNMAIANGHRVAVYIDPFINEGMDHEAFAFSNYLYRYEDLEAFKAYDGKKICITIQNAVRVLGHAYKAIEDLYIYPSKSVVVGTGCRQGVSTPHYKEMLDKALEASEINIESLYEFTSIVLKASEPCILETAEDLNCKTSFHLPHDLHKVEALFEGSDFVKRTTGVAAVAGPSAYLITQDNLTFKIYKDNACTFSFGRIKL